VGGVSVRNFGGKLRKGASAIMLRIQTSFQDTPGGGYYFVLLHDGRNLSDQIEELGLKDGDTVLLWEPDCGGHAIEAKLLFDYHHPMMSEPMLGPRKFQTETPSGYR
jgi:hypothetical protein